MSLLGGLVAMATCHAPMTFYATQEICVHEIRLFCYSKQYKTNLSQLQSFWSVLMATRKPNHCVGIQYF